MKVTKKTAFLFFTSVLAMSSVACEAEETATKTESAADQLITGAIYTGNDKDEIVSAVAVKDGIIVYAGDEAGADAYIDENTERVNLSSEQLATPGIVDAHTHAGAYKVGELKMCKLSEGATPEECVKELSEFIKERPDSTVYWGKGWINSAFDNGCPTADYLDQIDTDKPIIVESSDGHSYWVNSVMIKLAGVTSETEDPKGGKIERYNDGSPNGCFRDTAQHIIRKVLPVATAESKIPGIMAAMEEYASIGYTGFMDIITNEQFDPAIHPLLDAYEMLDQDGKLQMYIQGGFTINNNEKALDMVDEAIRLRDETAGGMFELTNIKIYMDGVIEGSTAYLSEPYANNPDSRGSSRWIAKEDKELLTKIIERANEAGMTVHFHAIGDQAISDAIDCVENAYNNIGDKVIESRNVITHLQIVQEKDFDRMAKLGMVAAINPWCTKYPGFYEETEVAYLGEERASKEYPVKSFVDHNVNVSFGTDYGASFTYKAIPCIHILTTRLTDDNDPNSLLNPAERLTTAEVLKMMSSGCAYQLHKEDVFGTIETGKRADIVVFSKNLLEIPETEIISAEVVKTMANGIWIYDSMS